LHLDFCRGNKIEEKNSEKLKIFMFSKNAFKLLLNKIDGMSRFRSKKMIKNLTLEMQYCRVITSIKTKM
jgi:hypothetical protein